MVSEHSKPHYGFYSLPVIGLVVLFFVVGGGLIALWLSRGVGLVVASFGLYVAISYGISLLALGQDESPELPDILRLQGDEQALDVGCGLGPTTVAVAKHLASGRVTGVDLWSQMEVPGNSARRAAQNATIEGVGDRVTFRPEPINALDLPFPDASFDLVTASSVLNNLSGDDQKMQTLTEIRRVLRPGGRFLLIEPLRNLGSFLLFTPLGFWQISSQEKWEERLHSAGLVGLRYAQRGMLGCFLVEKPL